VFIGTDSDLTDDVLSIHRLVQMFIYDAMDNEQRMNVLASLKKETESADSNTFRYTPPLEQL